MVTHDKIDDLTRIFQLFSRVDSDHRILTWGVTAHIQSIGKEINAGLVSQPTTTTVSIKGKEPEGSAPPPTNTAEATLSAALKWVELVLELKIKYDNILKEAFSNEPKMKSCVVEGFSSFINANPKTPEFVSLFIDENLKKGIKGKSEAETDMILDNATVLFRYIKDKDVFERYYKSHLAKRLLQGRSVSDDAERGMLAKLRLVAGYAFTTKLEGMFKDMKTSRDIMVDYKKHLSQSRTHDDKSLELLVSVLTSTYWPLSFSAAGGIGKCVFPPVVEKAKSSFTQFYLGRHQGRQLSWHGGMVDKATSITLTLGKCRHPCYL
jgi:cullin 3